MKAATLMTTSELHAELLAMLARSKDPDVRPLSQNVARAKYDCLQAEATHRATTAREIRAARLESRW